MEPHTAALHGGCHVDPRSVELRASQKSLFQAFAIASHSARQLYQAPTQYSGALGTGSLGRRGTVESTADSTVEFMVRSVYTAVPTTVSSVISVSAERPQ